MRCPGNVPSLSGLLTSEDQVVAELRTVKILAVDPRYRSLGALTQKVFGTLTRCDHPVLNLPGLCLLLFAVLLMLLVRVVGTACERAETECETTGELNRAASVSEG